MVATLNKGFAATNPVSIVHPFIRPVQLYKCRMDLNLFSKPFCSFFFPPHCLLLFACYTQMMIATSRALWFCLVTWWWCDGGAAIDGILWWLCMFAQRTLLMVMCCFLFRHAGGEGCRHQRSVDGVHVHGAPTACVLWGGETSPAAADWCRAGQGKDWVEMPTNWKTSILTGENRLDQNSLDWRWGDFLFVFWMWQSLYSEPTSSNAIGRGGGGGGFCALFISAIANT